MPSQQIQANKEIEENQRKNEERKCNFHLFIFYYYSFIIFDAYNISNFFFLKKK